MGDRPDLAAKDARDAPHDGGPKEAAHYLKGAIAELAQVARIHRMDMLGYLLDMAQLEAEETLRRSHRNPL